MATPNFEGLRQVAQYNVGDKAYLSTNGTWTVTARYWSPGKQCIVYDLVYDYNGVELPRVEEHRLSRQNKGVGAR